MLINPYLKTTALVVSTFALGVGSTVLWYHWQVKKADTTTDQSNHQVLLGLFRKMSDTYLLGVTEFSLNKDNLVAYAAVLKGRLSAAIDDIVELKRDIANKGQAILAPCPKSPSKFESAKVDSEVDVSKV